MTFSLLSNIRAWQLALKHCIDKWSAEFYLSVWIVLIVGTELQSVRVKLLRDGAEGGWRGVFVEEGGGLETMRALFRHFHPDGALHSRVFTNTFYLLWKPKRFISKSCPNWLNEYLAKCYVICLSKIRCLDFAITFRTIVWPPLSLLCTFYFRRNF